MNFPFDSFYIAVNQSRCYNVSKNGYSVDSYRFFDCPQHTSVLSFQRGFQTPLFFLEEPQTIIERSECRTIKQSNILTIYTIDYYSVFYLYYILTCPSYFFIFLLFSIFFSGSLLHCGVSY